ncbi:MAG: hypothetical protein JNK24_00765 [Alphaproteobacteria bacterium]|nr:hypothetical protein [Alphaproteobacteria bacterium]
MAEKPKKSFAVLLNVRPRIKCGVTGGGGVTDGAGVASGVASGAGVTGGEIVNVESGLRYCRISPDVGSARIERS